MPEARQRAQDIFVVDAFFGRHRHRRRRVQRIVAPRRVQRHRQQRFVLTAQGKVPLRANLPVVFDAHVGIFTEAVGGDMATHARQQLAHYRIVDAHHRTAVERQVVQEIDKRLLQILEVAR